VDRGHGSPAGPLSLPAGLAAAKVPAMNDSARTITTVGLDADDTLWHNETISRLPQDRFVALLAPYADEPDLRERLAAVERRNLHLYGYGVKGFTLSMVETAMEVGQGADLTPVLREILASGREMLAH